MATINKRMKSLSYPNGNDTVKYEIVDEAARSDLSVLKPSAESTDVGKFLKVKTVSGGKVTEYEFGEGGGSGGTSDYSDLENKPSINSNTLSGNKTANQLGLYGMFDSNDEPANSIADLSDYDNHSSVLIFGTPMSFGNAKIFDEPNIIKGRTTTATISGTLSFSQFGTSFLFNGTKQAESAAKYPILIEEEVSLAASTELKILAESSSDLSALTSDLIINFIATDDTSQYVYIIPSSSTTSVTRTVTLSKAIKKIKVQMEIPAAAATIDNMKVWIGLFSSSVTTVDTELVVSDGQSNTYTSNTLAEWESIDFGKYNGAVPYQVTDLKGYIDGITPDITMAYTQPEDFGAVGRGETDDYAAVQACIDYALENFVPVRAYGNYAISQPLVIDGEGIDFEINSILPSFNDYAIKVSGSHHKVKINYIYNNTGGGGLLLTILTGHSFEANSIEVHRVWVNNGNAIRMYCTNDPLNVMAYNSIRFGHLFSRYDDCYYAENGYGEDTIYGGKLQASNGWAINLINHSFCKFYGVSMEQDCYSGIRMENSGHNGFYGFRDIELIMRKTDATDRGTLLKLVGFGMTNYITTADTIYGEAIDISQTTKIRDYNDWQIARTDNFCIIESQTGISTVVEHTYGLNILNPPNKDCSRAIIKPERIICVPQTKEIIRVSDDLDLSIIPYEGQYARFIVSDDSAIKLSPSYSPAGTHEFTLNNVGSNTFSVTDCNDVLLYGSSTAGEYKFYCFVDNDNVYRGVLGNDVPGWWNGENDLWFVETGGNTVAEIHLQPYYCDINDTVTLSGEFVTSGTWSSSDTDVATVSSGVVTAAGAGRATITITNTNGKVERWVIDVAAAEESET